MRRGEAGDLLGGIVRLTSPGDRPIDLIVGRSPWQATMAADAERTVIQGLQIPVVRVSDLILLKLSAGGPQNVADIHQLLDRGDRDDVAARVEASLMSLPRAARALWTRIVKGDAR